jgi:hypothetical protein
MTSRFEECGAALDATEMWLGKAGEAFYRLEHDPLLLAAPELLEALRNVLRYCQEPIENTHDLVAGDDIFEKARAAIAKAEGREP